MCCHTPSKYRACLLILVVAVCAAHFSGCTRTDNPPAKQLDELEKIKRKTAADFPDISHVDTKQVAQWMEGKDKPVIVDVREADEFAVSHLPNAVRLSPAASADDAGNTVLQDVAKDRRIVLYCSVGLRSSKMAKRLRDAGFTNVHNMSGSIFQWANDGRPLQSDTGPAEKVHPFNSKWGELLKPQYRAKVED